MKLTVFGANGRTGRHVVRVALERGHDVTAFVRRDPEDMPADGHLQLAIGDVRSDRVAVATAVRAADAVIVALGPRSPLEGGLSTDALTNIVAGMEASGSRRLVVLSALGLSQAMPAPPALRLVGATLLRKVATDKRRSEQILARSSLEWTVVLPGPLTDRPCAPVAASDHASDSARVCRADVAPILLDLAEEPSPPATAVAIVPIDKRTLAAGQPNRGLPSS